MQTCNGCVNLNVQRLCYGAQQCTLARCIGTLTNQNRWAAPYMNTLPSSTTRCLVRVRTTSCAVLDCCLAPHEGS